MDLSVGVFCGLLMGMVKKLCPFKKCMKEKSTAPKYNKYQAKNCMKHKQECCTEYLVKQHNYECDIVFKTTVQ